MSTYINQPKKLFCPFFTVDDSLPNIDWDAVRNETYEKTDWETHLGNKDDPISKIRMRFPNGRLVLKEFPCSSQFLVSSKSH